MLYPETAHCSHKQLPLKDMNLLNKEILPASSKVQKDDTEFPKPVSKKVKLENFNSPSLSSSNSFFSRKSIIAKDAQAYETFPNQNNL